jgi:hypothetical protein
MHDETVFYKIRHKKTGLYSKGGAYVNAEGNNIFWTKTGKTWDTIGKLRSHITSHLNKYYGATDMSDWEVIEFKCVPTAVKDIHEIVTQKRLVELLTRANN